ncbi:uncharacterized protein Dana_GF22794 [Drosophila ananassae]|uniref:Uncharacterized protein n=1 Tax=Drosophila ananassae TaxID=7217 RepID=B3MUY1_DROAN|nr:uncharacterized protein LOC6505447 [Drosophila ananassae]EDV33046.1 uncharacterized protein Dana_GF22794 [Drosophila ananassae]
MFQKRIIELITVLFYWMILVPIIYNYCKGKKIIEMDMNKLIDSMTTHATFVLCLMIGYVILYRIVMFTYMKLKVCDIEMWHTLKKTKEDPESYLQKTHYQPVSLEHIDVVDSGKKKKANTLGSPQMIRTISDPLLTEGDLARIHIKHETKPLSSATMPRVHQVNVHPSPSPSLRSAPAVPKKDKSGVIMSPMMPPCQVV